MASGSLWRSARPLIAGRGVSAIVGVALPAVLAQALDQASYGTYKQVYLVANLALYSLQLGLAQSLFYFVPRAAEDGEKRRYIGQTQLTLAIVGALTCLGIVLGTPLIAAKFSNPQLGEVALPLGLLAGALIASSPFEISLTARGKPQWSALALVSTDLLRVGMMLTAVLLGLGIVGLAWAAALAAVVRWVGCLALAGGFGHFALDKHTMKTQFAYSLPFGAAVLLLQQQMQLHQIFVSARATPALFAIYSVGCMQIPIVSLLYTPVSETLQVRLAALERTGETHLAGHVFSDAVDKLAMIFLPLCALLIATAKAGIVGLYGSRYADAANVMQIAVVSVAVASLPVDGVFKARAKTGMLLWIYAAKLAITWPMVAGGYALFGMEGAIAGHVMVEVVTKIGQLVIIAKDLKLPVAELLGGKAVLRSGVVALVTGVAAAGVAAVVAHSESRWVNLGACAVAGGIAAGVFAADLWLRRKKARNGRPVKPEGMARAA